MHELYLGHLLPGLRQLGLLELRRNHLRGEHWQQLVRLVRGGQVRERHGRLGLLRLPRGHLLECGRGSVLELRRGELPINRGVGLVRELRRGDLRRDDGLDLRLQLRQLRDRDVLGLGRQRVHQLRRRHLPRQERPFELQQLLEGILRGVGGVKRLR